MAGSFEIEGLAALAPHLFPLPKERTIALRPFNPVRENKLGVCLLLNLAAKTCPS